MKQSIDVTIGMKADTSGAEAVKHALGSLSQEAEKVNATVKGASLEMGTAMEAARGSANGIVKLVVALIKRTGHLKDMSLAAVGAIAGAITSLVRLGGAVKDLFSYTFNLGQAPADIRACSSAVYDMQSSAADFADAMKTARTDAAELTKSFNAQVDATNKLVKAQNELHRAQELAAAKNEDDRARINNAYNALNASSDDEVAAQKIARRERDLNDEESRLLAEIVRAEKDRDTFLANAERLTAKGNGKRSNAFVSLFYSGNNERASAYFSEAASNRGLAFEKDEEIAAAKKKLELLKSAREQLDIERKAIAAASTTHAQQAQNAESELAAKIAKTAADNKKKIESEAARIIAAEEDRLAKERESVQNKIARNLLAEQINGARAAHDARMKQLDDEKSKAEDAVRVWDDAAKRARDSARNGGGFGGWLASERDKDRANERAKRNQDNAREQAMREAEKLRKDMARGKGFITPQRMKHLADLERFAAYQDPANNPGKAELERIEKEKAENVAKLTETVNTIQTQLATLGL